MKVIKRNGRSQDFDTDKIVRVVSSANESVPENERITDEQITKLVKTLVKNFKGWNELTTEDIDRIVTDILVNKFKAASVVRAYIQKREAKKSKKMFNDIEEKVLAIIEGDSDLRGDNANKHIDQNPSISDYIAGVTTKSINEKIMDKDISEFHKRGLGHMHDTDYSPIRPMHNCDLINAGDMFENTFMMGDTKIVPNDGTPFETICNLMAQINLQVSGVQYGGQTISWIHAVPYIDKSRKIIEKRIREEWEEDGVEFNEEKFRKRVEKRLREEVAKGVKTYQYQVLCHSSSNGQTPFVSNNLCLKEAETQQELDDFVMLIEEILKRRTKGVQDESGQYISPLFPKLLYWTCDGYNVYPGDPYYHLMDYVAECESLRMQPDICSEKQTRLVKNGQIIPSMGCRSMLSPIWEEHTYPVDKEFYFVEGVGTYPYGTFVDKKSFKDFENREYKTGYEDGEVAINFRGNTGWLVRKDEKEVVIKEPVVYGRFNCGVFSLNLPHIALTSAYPEYSIKDEDIVNFEGVDMRPADILLIVEKDGAETSQDGTKVYPVDNIEIKDYGTIDHFEISTDSEGKRKVKIIYQISEEDKIQNFYEILDDRLEIAHRALQMRYKYIRRIKAKNSPILWQFGALARMSAEETVGDLIDRYPTRPSISIGYAGLYETCQALIGESNITPKGQRLSQSILQHLNDKAAEWKAAEGLGYAIYGTPEESLTYKFALANRRDFGLIPKITDKDYVVNSYHIDPREHVDAFTKLRIEGSYLALSAGGAVSYVETADLIKNPEAIVTLVQFIHEHIMYAEINRKIGVCRVCGYIGDIPLIKENGEFIFKCPNCGNSDDSKMDVTARICGYLGKVNAGNTNKGRLDDIYNRVLHTDCEDEVDINMTMHKNVETPICL